MGEGVGEVVQPTTQVPGIEKDRSLYSCSNPKTSSRLSFFRSPLKATSQALVLHDPYMLKPLAHLFGTLLILLENTLYICRGDGPVSLGEVINDALRFPTCLIIEGDVGIDTELTDHAKVRERPTYLGEDFLESFPLVDRLHHDLRHVTTYQQLGASLWRPEEP